MRGRKQNIAFVWDLITLWWSCGSLSAEGSLPTRECCLSSVWDMQRSKQGICYCKLYISFQQLDWGPAIASVAVNPVFVFIRYISPSVFWNFPARSSDG